MNLVEVLVPRKSILQAADAERAERTECQQPRELLSPPEGAQTGGKVTAAAETRPVPPGGAKSESRTVTAFPPNSPNSPTEAHRTEAPLPITMEFFAIQRVRLLPEDLAFLRRHLPKGTLCRNATLRRYLDTWRLAAQSEPVPHCKENAGRHAANSWLRGAML